MSSSVKVSKCNLCESVEVSAGMSLELCYTVKAEAVGVGPSNPPTSLVRSVVMACWATEVGDCHGHVLEDLCELATSEPALVNLNGFSYAGYGCGVVHGVLSVNSSGVRGYVAYCEHHANDVGW